MCPEYTWLLTALFHDIGRPKQSGAKLLAAELDDEDIEVTVSGKETRWLRENWEAARRTLGSLAACVADETNDDPWDGGCIPDEDGARIAIQWTRLYDSMSSHAIISAFDLLADIFKMSSASGERRNRQFVVTHAAPAALSILLHDWRLWEEVRACGLFPINASRLPMAALLVYLDTWDDYRRKGGISDIRIRDYALSPAGVRVEIEWGDAGAYEKEKIKYEAFDKAMRNEPFGLNIATIVPRPT
jgi:hypothetical protein